MEGDAGEMEKQGRTSISMYTSPWIMTSIVKAREPSETVGRDRHSQDDRLGRGQSLPRVCVVGLPNSVEGGQEAEFKLWTPSAFPQPAGLGC